MPTGRLTRDDRQYIADRLAEGTPYAEIARALRRPTSTVSREVNRNGGPRRYRPEQAQRAAMMRARRRPVRPAAAGTVTPPRDGRDPETVGRLRDDLTALVVGTGLAPMASRVLIRLFTEDTGTLTAAELTAQLGVSPASVSKAVADLERQGLLRRERDAGLRRDRYVVDDDVWIRAWLASARSNQVLADATGAAARMLGPDTPAGSRLHHTSRFLDQVMRDMTEAAERRAGLLRPRLDGPARESSSAQ